MDKNTIIKHILENTEQRMRNAAREEKSSVSERETIERRSDEKRGREGLLAPLAVGIIILLLVN